MSTLEFEAENEYEEEFMEKEELLAILDQAFKDIKAGRVYPASELFKELEDEEEEK